MLARFRGLFESACGTAWVIQHQNKGRFAQRLAKFQHTHLTETRLDTEIRLCLQGNRARVCRPRGAYGMLVEKFKRRHEGEQQYILSPHYVGYA